MGWSEGPALGTDLAALEELQLDGELRTREEALERARSDLPGTPPV
jgi:hypothetical protein